MNINRRERLWYGVIGFKGRNSFGVEAPRARIPKVAHSSQPWALLRNPFGIKRDRRALRRLRDQKLSPIPAQTPAFRKNHFLFETGRRAGLGRDPLIEGFLTLDDQHAGGHSGMGIAAKLGAVNLVTAFFGRLEPERGAHSGNGVLSYSHRNDLEGVDDI